MKTILYAIAISVLLTASPPLAAAQQCQPGHYEFGQPNGPAVVDVTCSGAAMRITIQRPGEPEELYRNVYDVDLASRAVTITQGGRLLATLVWSPPPVAPPLISGCPGAPGPVPYSHPCIQKIRADLLGDIRIIKEIHSSAATMLEFKAALAHLAGGELAGRLFEDILRDGAKTDFGPADPRWLERPGAGTQPTKSAFSKKPGLAEALVEKP